MIRSPTLDHFSIVDPTLATLLRTDAQRQPPANTNTTVPTRRFLHIRCREALKEAFLATKPPEDIAKLFVDCDKQPPMLQVS